jgi:hypothetical protein
VIFSRVPQVQPDEPEIDTEIVLQERDADDFSPSPDKTPSPTVQPADYIIDDGRLHRVTESQY